MKISDLSREQRKEVAGQCYRDMSMWLDETRHWAEQFRTFHASPTGQIDGLVRAATYFVLSAGCVYLHGETVVEVAKGKNEAATWSVALDDDPVIKSLRHRRNKLNHGHLRQYADYTLGRHLTVGLRETLSFTDSFTAVVDGQTVHETVPPPATISEAPTVTFDMAWLDVYGHLASTMEDWHGLVIVSLEHLIAELPEDPMIGTLVTD